MNPYSVDIMAIWDSKAIRRESDKTQVFIDPSYTHVRRRAQHTNEVASKALQISELTGLNPVFQAVRIPLKIRQ